MKLKPLRDSLNLKHTGKDTVRYNYGTVIKAKRPPSGEKHKQVRCVQLQWALVHCPIVTTAAPKSSHRHPQIPYDYLLAGQRVCGCGVHGTERTRR